MSDEALRQALEERNRLWQRLEEHRAQDAELAHWRARVDEMERSLSWRITAPLRLLQRALADPGYTLRWLAWRLRQLRGG